MDRSWEYINRSQTHECGNEATQFPEKEYLNGIRSRNMFFFSGVEILSRTRLYQLSNKFKGILGKDPYRMRNTQTDLFIEEGRAASISPH